MMRRLQNTIRKITAHSNTHNIWVRHLGSYVRRISLKVLSGFSRLALSKSCTDRRILSPNDCSHGRGIRHWKNMEG